MKKQDSTQAQENEVLRRMLNTPPVPHKPKEGKTKKVIKTQKKSA